MMAYLMLQRRVGAQPASGRSCSWRDRCILMQNDRALVDSYLIVPVGDGTNDAPALKVSDLILVL